MRLVIDMQGAQSEFSGGRGVGRYTRELTKKLILCSRGEIEIYLALNGSLDCQGIFEYFEGILDREHIKVWNYYPYVPCACKSDFLTVHPSELFREWFLHQFHADAIWVPNYQEGYMEANIATSINLTKGTEYLISTLHDVTPLLFRDTFLRDETIRTWYANKIKYVRDSDIVLTDSEFSKEKIAELTRIDIQKIEVILLAYDEQTFYKDDNYIDANSKEKYFLYAGGMDPHKNLRSLLKAYSKLDEEKRDSYHIKLAGSVCEEDKKKILDFALPLEIKKEQIEFLGFVSDDELRKLMQRCTGFIFPAYSEGFGLPPLEAIACGAPTIVADATSLKEIVTDKEAVFDPFDADRIAELLGKLICDKSFSNKLIQSGLKRKEVFSWEKAGEQFRDILLKLPKRREGLVYSKKDLCNDLRKLINSNDYQYKAQLAKSIEHSTLFTNKKHIYVDTSAVVLENYVSGIQRLVNGIIANLKEIFSDREDIIVEAVYSDLSKECFFRSDYNGVKYIKKVFEQRGDIIDFCDGDIFIMPDLHTMNVISKRKTLKELCDRGVQVVSVLCDLIPVEYPDFFPQSFVKEYEEWLECIAEFSGVISISESTMNLYLQWCKDNEIELPPYFIMDFNHLGSDIGKANPTKGIPENGSAVLEAITSRPTMLMVGTIEPRKKHDQVLAAMEELWKSNKDYNLVFVGRNGWHMDDFVEKMNSHKEKGKRFFWLSGISDEFLEQVYNASTGVIVASLEEGYGLPIIEAAQHGKPLLLRDIPVFREIACENAEYFDSMESHEISIAIENWITKLNSGIAKDSSAIRYYTWKESTKNLIRKIAPKLLDE